MVRSFVVAVVLAVGCACVAPPAHSPGAPAPDAATSARDLATLTPALSRAGTAKVADIAWLQHLYMTAAGEPVDVSVSTAYAAGADVGQRWANFFASLLHGPELAQLKVYVAPLDEVQSICGMSAVGCYGDDQLMLVNGTALGFDAEEVARHEYGHHIAFNRLNTPWPAVDWGPKHWATAADVCARASSARAYPGDESLLYKLNPGEAFAETYRVLVDTMLGEAQPSWPLVDRSFYPDRAELEAVEQDVSAPWTGPTTQTFHARLNGKAKWERRVSTPLDGTITLRVSAPRGIDARVVLLAADGRRRIAVDQSRGGRLTIGTQICGERSMIVRVQAVGLRGRRVAVRVTAP